MVSQGRAGSAVNSVADVGLQGGQRLLEVGEELLCCGLSRSEGRIKARVRGRGIELEVGLYPSGDDRNVGEEGQSPSQADGEPQARGGHRDSAVGFLLAKIDLVCAIADDGADRGVGGDQIRPETAAKGRAGEVGEVVLLVTVEKASVVAGT